MCNENETTGKVNESFVFKLSLKDYLLRMLILGSRVSKYDQRTKNLSSDDIEFIQLQIKAGHGEEIFTITRDVYNESRAPNKAVRPYRNTISYCLQAHNSVSNFFDRAFSRYSYL